MKATRDHHHFSLSNLPGYAEQCAKFEAMLRSARPGTPEFEMATVFNWDLDASVGKYAASDARDETDGVPA